MDRSDSSVPPEEPFEDPDGLGGEMGAISGDDFDAGLEQQDSEETAMRGWIPPDDRLWLHPSEIGRDSRMLALDGARRRARRADRRSLFAAGVVGTAALTAAIAAVALAATSSSPIAGSSSFYTPQLTNSVTSTLSHSADAATLICSDSMPPRTCKAIERVRPSMLRISVKNGKNTAEGTALVVPVASETIVITAASLVGNAGSVAAFDQSGKSRHVKVLGVDTRAGVAVLQVPWAVPSAPIAQETLSTGQFLLLACLGPSSGAMLPETVPVEDPDTTDPPLMDAIDVDISPLTTPGGVLLDSAGDVIGLLDATTETKSNDPTGEFVPAWLAVGVARRIVTENHNGLIHGWLDVVGTNADGGALVLAVPSEGPAAEAGLRPGDVVVGMITSNGMDPILSMGDLQGRLYLEPPGARIELQVEHGNQMLLLSPVLTSTALTDAALP